MRYQTDLTDREGETIRLHFEYRNGYGNRRKHPIRTMLNAIFYVIKTGCQWRMLPKEFPPWQSVYAYYRRLCQAGRWEKALDDLNRLDRLRRGREPSPSYAIVDSQSVKTVYRGSKRGFDGGKKSKGAQTASRRRYRGPSVACPSQCRQRARRDGGDRGV